MRLHSQSCRIGLLLLALLWLPAGLGAQNRSIPFARLSIEDGLSQGTVRCILQDSDGYLWLGTQDGLNRYDGYGFEVYKHDPTDSSSLPANWIDALALDPSGDLWIGTQGGGLARWRRATDTFESARTPGSWVRALHFDRAGRLWVGTSESGLARLDPESGEIESYRHDPEDSYSLADDRVRAIYEDSAGVLWVGTLGGLDRLSGRAGPFSHFRHDPADETSLSDDRVTAILEGPDGALWVGTERGLNRRQRGRGGFVRYVHDPADPSSLGHDLVRMLSVDRAGRLWIGTDGGLNLLASSRESFVRYLHDPADPSSLSNDRVASLYQDAGGVLWVGTQGGGVNKWNPITWSFAHYRAEPGDPAGLSSNAVFSLSEDADGRLWIGTFGGGLNVLDRETQEFTHYRHDPLDPGSLAGDQIVALLHDRDDVLWVGVRGRGLARFDAATQGFRSFRHDPERPGSLSDDSVSALHQDSAGTLWVATFRGGLNRFEAASETFSSFRNEPDRPRSLSSDAVTTLTEDARGALWIGTFGAGLNRLEGSSADAVPEFLALRHDARRSESLSNDTVYSLHTDADAQLWVGTQVGLNKLLSEEEGRFRHYFERDGLAGDAVWGIRHDAKGRLWIATGGGLSRFDPRAEAFKNYRASHGLQSNEFNAGAHYASESGELFFGGVGGFNAFYPERIESNAAVPPVVLRAFTRHGQPVDFGRPLSQVEEILLSHRDRLFSFELAALDFTAPAENRYRYQLEGFDDGWIDLGHRRRVTLTNLAPGRYVLRAQGANNDGVWNSEGASVRLTVQPPFWQTWWFRLAGALALVGALWGGHRWLMGRAARRQQELAEAERAAERERLIAQLEAKNAELERFAYTVSHDLKAPLVTIKGFLGYARRDAAAEDAERLERDIARIDAAAEKMHRLVEDLLQLTRLGYQRHPPQEVPFGELAAEAVELVAGQIAECGAEVRVAPDLPVVRVDRPRLVEALQNLLQNAAKYMGDQAAPRIEIGARRQGGGSVFYVRDNGMGIERKYQEKIFELFQRLSAETEGTGIGLALVRRIVELHGGRVWVESEGSGRGSTFCFTLGAGPRTAGGETRK